MKKQNKQNKTKKSAVSKKTVTKNKNNKNKSAKRVVKAATMSPGRPRVDISYPRKKKFTLSDVLKINDVSVLTVRKRLAEDATVVDRIPQAGRGHPTHVYALN